MHLGFCFKSQILARMASYNKANIWCIPLHVLVSYFLFSLLQGKTFLCYKNRFWCRDTVVSSSHCPVIYFVAVFVFYSYLRIILVDQITNDAPQLHTHYTVRYTVQDTKQFTVQYICRTVDSKNYYKPFRRLYNICTIQSTVQSIKQIILKPRLIKLVHPP